MANLERMIRDLHDVEEIKKLKARYIDGCDGGWADRISHDPQQIVPLFTEDCVWDGGDYGFRSGREGLLQYYEDFKVGDRTSAFHLLTNPVIDVDGDVARGEWHLTILFTTNEGQNLLICGVFDDEYRRTDQGWRIHRSQFTRAVSGEYDEAWHAMA